MALHLLLYPIICHHARHANQTSHVIVFRLLNLVKVTMRSLLRKVSILNLRSQQLKDNYSLRYLNFASRLGQKAHMLGHINFFLFFFFFFFRDVEKSKEHLDPQKNHTPRRSAQPSIRSRSLSRSRPTLGCGHCFKVPADLEQPCYYVVECMMGMQCSYTNSRHY